MILNRILCWDNKSTTSLLRDLTWVSRIPLSTGRHNNYSCSKLSQNLDLRPILDISGDSLTSLALGTAICSLSPFRISFVSNSCTGQMSRCKHFHWNGNVHATSYSIFRCLSVPVNKALSSQFPQKTIWAKILSQRKNKQFQQKSQSNYLALGWNRKLLHSAVNAFLEY